MVVLAFIIGILVLGILIFIHELGHLIAAKACKFKVEAFALGFGRPIFKFSRGGTEYRLNMIPFGGYCAMASDSPVGETAGGASEFNSHPIWQRATVAVAGPLANLVCAVLMLWVMFMYGVDRPLYLDSSKVGFVMRGSPADSAGFMAGDSILSINGEQITAWEQVESRLVFHDLYDIVVARGGDSVRLGLRVEKAGAHFPKFPSGGIRPVMLAPAVIGRVMPDGSSKNTLAEGDTILTINGAEIALFSDISAAMRQYDFKDGPVSLDIKRGGGAQSVFVMPAFDSASNRYMLGISPVSEPTRKVRYSPVEAAGPTVNKTWEYTTMLFSVIGKMTKGQVSAEQLSGPLNIIPMSGFVALSGLSGLLDFMALIGINLAVLNLLPLVITDGGLLLFLLIEAVRGKPLPERAQAAINRVFVALFIALFLFVSFNDIQRLPFFLGLR